MPTPYIRDFVSGYYSNRNPISGQIQDAVIAGSNFQHTERNTWIRKPGMRRWSSVNIGGSDSPMKLFSYTDGSTQRILVDSLSDIREATTTTITPLLDKIGSGNQTSFAASQNVVYAVSNTTGGVLHKRISSEPFKPWGITRPSVAPTLSVVDGSGQKIRIGWRYVYVYRDDADTHISSMSDVSVNTNNHTLATVHVTVTGTDQTRVSHIEIYRTRDGGGEFYFLTKIANPGLGATATFDDAVPDTDLNKFIQAPSASSNEPPPAGMTDLVRHNARFFGITERGVQYNARHNVDFPLNGIEEECWPADFEFRFTAPIALAPTSRGLLVFTRSGVTYMIVGQSFADLTPIEVFSGLPISSKNEVAKDGDFLYVYTSKRELLRISEEGVTRIDQALSAEDLSDFVPGSCYLTVHRSGTDSSIYLSNGNSKLRVFNVMTNSWSPVWEADGINVTIQMVQSIQTSLSEFELILGPREGFSGYLWKQDDSIHTNDTEVYGGSLVFSFMLAGPKDWSALEWISVEASVVPKRVSILVNEIDGTMTPMTVRVGDPPLLPDSTTLASLVYYPHTTDVVRRARRLQIEIEFEAVDDAAELYGLGFGHGDPR